jgi:uncharacterized membrane protein YraQ (UPF0718 family)
MIEIPQIVIEQLWTLVVALIAAIVVYIQNKQKNDSVAAFDVTSTQSSNPEIVASLPERTWKMSDSTKRWLTFDATSENKATILSQIEAAENEHKVEYQIVFDGGYYNIEYGLLKGSAGNPHDIG